MKKLLAWIVCVAMCLGLAACSSPTPNGGEDVSEAPSPVESEQPVESAPAEESTDSATELDTFLIDADTFMTNFVSISGQDLGDPEEMDDSDYLDPGVTEIAYDFGDYASLLYKVSPSGMLMDVSLMVRVNAVDTEEESKDLFKTMATLILMLEPDDDMVANVTADLGIDEYGFTDGTLTFATGSIAEYMYTVSSSVAWLSITPR